jgi:mycofactocin system glycosyltransferase
VSQLLPLAPSPVEAPIPAGTRVLLDAQAKFIDRDLLSGGSPWRLLRLPGGSRTVAERWRGGGEVRSGEERFARTLLQQGLVHLVLAPEAHVGDVDVVIPVRDDATSLGALLGRLEGLHVTIVDDDTHDSAAVDQCAERFGASLVRLGVNVGPGGARNAGALATLRPLLWFLDVDVEMDDPLDVLGRLQPQFDDPLVGAVAPRIFGSAGVTARECFEQRFSPLDMGVHSALVVPGGAVGYVPSACLLVRRDCFGEGFDDTLRVGEDVDLVWRLHDRGWLVRYVADVVVTHRARATWRRWWAQRVEYGASSGELARRHGARMAPFRADAWTLVAWASVVAGKPMFGARIARVARDRLKSRLAETTDDPAQVAGELVGRGLVGAGGPLARALVRTFGLFVLSATIHPRLRRRAIAVFAVGTAWRWRSARVHLSDIPLAIADDMAYGAGVLHGAWRSRSLGALKPHITKSTMGPRDILGLRFGLKGR